MKTTEIYFGKEGEGLNSEPNERGEREVFTWKCHCRYVQDEGKEYVFEAARLMADSLDADSFVIPKYDKNVILHVKHYFIHAV